MIIGLGSFVFANPDNQENFEEGDIEERDGQGSDRDGSSSSDDDSSDEDETDSSNLLTDGSDNQLGNAVDNDNSRGNNLSGNGNDSTLSGGTGQTSGTEEIPTITDNTYADALKAVEQAESSLVQGDVDYATGLVNQVTNQSQKDELNSRLEAVQDIIDVTALIERLETMVANSTNRDGIVESIDYRDDEKIEELVTNLNNGTAKDNLASRLETVNKILNDIDGPDISGIDNNGFTRKDSVSLTISDDNEVTTTVMLNGNPVDYSDSFTEEGTYVVTAVDAAFNERTLTFTIDRTKPVVGGVEDGKYYNTEVAVTIDDTNPGTVHLKKNGELVKPYNAGDPITEEGTYTVVVTDKAGNKSKEITFVIDKHVEEPKWVYILNLSDENNRKTIRNGQTLRVEVNFDEELTELPVLTIGNSQSVTFKKCNETDYGKYVCVADLTIDNTIANLEDGEIPFTITNIYDKAGNTITLDNDNVTETKEYGQVTYDGTAPVVKSLGVTDINEYKDEVGKLYAKYGDTVRVLIYFDEKLGTEPTVKLGGKEFTATYRKASSTKDEAYYADIKLTEDMDLSDGILSFGVYGYADEIGNVGVNLTEKDVNMSAYPSVTIDNTLPVLNFNNGFITSGYTVEATDDNFAYMTVQYYDGRETETIESNTFTLDKEGDNTRYNIKAYDKAGNVSEYRDIYLDNANPVVSGTAINGGEEVSVENNGTYQEVTLNISDGSLKKVSLVKEDGTEEVLETYKDNYKNTKLTFEKKYTEEGTYTIKAVDRNNNESTITFTIDKTPATRVYSTLDFDKSGKQYYEVDKEKVYYVKNGDSFVFRMQFSEALKTAPTVKVGGMKVPMTLNEKFLNNEGKYIYEGTVNITEEAKLSQGRLEIVLSNVVDMAGNESTDEVVLNQTPTSNGRVAIYDKTVPSATKVQIINNSNPDSDYIKNGETVRVRVTFSEKLSTAPVLTIGNYTATFENVGDGKGNDLYSADITIKEDESELKEGKVAFTITGFRDLAGNTGDKVTEDSVESNITYDRTAPVYRSLGIVNLDEFKDEVGRLYAKTGDTVRVRLYFDEELGTEPTVKLGGKEFTATYRENSPKYAYYADIELTEDMNLSDGILSFEVYGYKDAIGNVGVNLTQDNINETAYPSVTIDNTLPVLNFNNGFITSGYTVEATDDNFAYMTVQYYDGRGTETIEGNTFTLDKAGDNTRYNIKAYDKAGNVSEYRDIYLDTEKPVVGGTAINGGKEVSVKNNGTYQEVTLNISDGSLKKVSLVKEDGTEEVLETYKDNFKNIKLTFEKKYAEDEEGTYTIKAVDRNNNESTITFTIDNTPAKVKAANILVDGDVNEQQYFYAKIGDTIYSYVRFSEKLKELPTFTLINDGNEYKAEEVIATGPNDAGEYTYSIRYTINEDTKMSDGEITMLVTNIKDLAGNKTDDVVKPTNSHIVYLDTTAPVFKDAEQTMESDVTINVKEDNLDRIEVTNKTTGETYQVENGHKLTEEGFYKIIAYDKAGNQSNVWNLTIDDEAPVITIENATSNNYYNHDVVVNISDIELQQTYLDGEKQGRVTTLTVKGDGTHTVSAVDRYGHKSEITFTIDTIPVALVELRVNSSNANNTVAKVGDYFGIYLNVNEELKEDPTFTVNGKEYKVNQPDGRKVGDNLYQYAVVYEVTDDMEEGEIQFTISNIYDKAGNPLNDLSNNDANGKVIIDKTAPTATITYNTVDPTNHSVVATLTASEEVKILNDGTWNPEDGYGLVFKKSYPENNIQTVTIEDKAGNQNTVEVVINNIDKEAPELVIDTIVDGVSNTENPQIHATDTNEFNISVKLNGKEVRNDKASLNENGIYSSWFGIDYMKDGSYEVTATDSLGNSKTISFELNRSE